MSSKQPNSEPLLSREEKIDTSQKNIAIRVADLSKCFQIYNKPQDRLKQSVFPRIQQIIGTPPTQYFREFWALKNVSFEIKKGETVGIIGCNGSGKSTLLQILCGTLTPTAGNVETKGRIAALLELGSGFNPEFTGRENVYMNAAVLGLSKKEVDERFEDITTFADIGEFIDQPVKTFSSGMMVRLAFAVSINVDPDILIIDEALSVGDELFQRKCFSRIEAIKKSGATILFVSHSGSTIVELCDRAVLMDSGEKLAVGIPKQIVGRYQKLLYAPSEKRQIIREQIRKTGCVQTTAATNTPSYEEAQPTLTDSLLDLEESLDKNLKPSSTIEYESHGAHIKSPKILTLDGRQVNQLLHGKSYRFQYTVAFNASAEKVRFSMLIKSVNGIELSGVGFPANDEELLCIKESEKASVEFSFACKLLPGIYYINVGCRGLVQEEEQFLHRIVDATCFRVIPRKDLGVRAGYFDFIEPVIYEIS